MGFIANMMKKKPQQINQDGKQYSFTPGENGSLTAPIRSMPVPLVPPTRNVAKVAPSPLVNNALASQPVLRPPLAINPGPSPTLADPAAQRKLLALKMINGRKLFSF